MEHKIDAQNQILGRLATRIAVLLRGKDKPGFDPARMSVNQVIVYNSDKIRVTGKKMVQKKYRRHSGYPGGLKEESMERLFARNSAEVLRKAVLGMLPKNRLRSRWIKNLEFRTSNQ